MITAMMLGCVYVRIEKKDVRGIHGNRHNLSCEREI